MTVKNNLLIILKIFFLPWVSVLFSRITSARYPKLIISFVFRHCKDTHKTPYTTQEYHTVCDNSLLFDLNQKRLIYIYRIIYRILSIICNKTVTSLTKAHRNKRAFMIRHRKLLIKRLSFRKQQKRNGDDACKRIKKDKEKKHPDKTTTAHVLATAYVTHNNKVWTKAVKSQHPQHARPPSPRHKTPGKTVHDNILIYSTLVKSI